MHLHKGGTQGACAPGGCDGVAHVSHVVPHGDAAHSASTWHRCHNLGWVAHVRSLWHKVAHMSQTKLKEAHVRHPRWSASTEMVSRGR